MRVREKKKERKEETKTSASAHRWASRKRRRLVASVGGEGRSASLEKTNRNTTGQGDAALRSFLPSLSLGALSLSPFPSLRAPAPCRRRAVEGKPAIEVRGAPVQGAGGWRRQRPGRDRRRRRRSKGSLFFGRGGKRRLFAPREAGRGGQSNCPHHSSFGGWGIDQK